MAEFPQSLIDIIEADPKAKPSPGATDEQIAKAEAEAGFSFPSSYRQFLLHFNGGAIGDYNMYGLNYAWEYDRDMIDEVQSLNGYAAGIQEGDVYPFGATWGGGLRLF